jgi:hypothetical protein
MPKANILTPKKIKKNSPPCWVIFWRLMMDSNENEKNVNEIVIELENVERV